MDVTAIRKDFPTIRNGRGVYLDSACMTLKPDCVIDKVMEYYNEYPACGGRSVHSMATRVSMEVDETRENLAHFFGCDDPNEFMFTKNTTEGMNTVARGLGLRKDDVVLTMDIEHNSNHVQWMMMQEEVGIKKRVCRTSDRGEFDIEEFERCIKGVKLVSVGHVSNVTGYEMPVKDIVQIAHDNGALVLVDGAQSAPHMKIDLKRLDVDFFCASLHKMLAPTGTGFMYGKSELLKELKPLMYGGGVVGLTTYDEVKLSPAPERFEAGLENYAGIIGTSAALDYLSAIGMENIPRHESMLQHRLQKGIEDIKGLHIVGSEDPDRRGGVFSFNIDGLNSHDIAMMVDNIDGIMIRSGMHCAHPFLVSRGIDGSARASMYIYNDESDIDRFCNALHKIVATFVR